MTVAVKGSCNPGYTFDNVTELCVCNINDENVVRCDENGRYIYIRVHTYHARMCNIMHAGK